MQKNLRKIYCCLFLLIFVFLQGCATGPKLVNHSFEFDGGWDKWELKADLLEYQYGDQYHMVREKVGPNRRRLSPKSRVNGAMPVGDFLYVKWRLIDSGEIVEDRVDLRKRLPLNMANQTLTFVIEDKQLYIFIVTNKPKKYYDEPPILKTFSSSTYISYEIYPTLNKN